LKHRVESRIISGALRILADDIVSDDGVANQCLREAAERIDELHIALHDAIDKPKGVVPDSALHLYDSEYDF